MSLDSDDCSFLIQDRGFDNTDPAEYDKIITLNFAQTQKLLNESDILKGVQGSQGVQGLPGPTGDNGSPGDLGSMGTQGSTGLPGAQGAQGLIGSSILGPTGAQGAQGAQGGAQGPQGALGNSVTGSPGSEPIGATGTAGVGVDLYLDLSDTPAAFTDVNQSLVVNSAGNAVTHTSLRTRIASSNSVVLSADNTASLSSSAGTVSGKYSFLACSSDSQNKATNTRSAVIACTDSQAYANRSAVIASDQCTILNTFTPSNLCILGSDQCTANRSGQCIIQSYDCNPNATYTSVISSYGCDPLSSFSTIMASNACYTRASYTTIISSSNSCDTRNKFSTIMTSRNSETSDEYTTIISSNKCNCYGQCSTISGSYDCDTGGTSTYNSIMASNGCAANGSYGFIGSSLDCTINSTFDMGTILSSSNCQLSGTNICGLINSSYNSTISNDYCAITASRNCSISESTNRIIASNNSSITSNPSSQNLVAACNDCDIISGDANQTSMMASSYCDVSSSTVNNSTIIASSSSNLSGSSQMAIIGCDSVTVSANNAAIIGCVGSTYNNSTSYSVRVRQVIAYTFTKISDVREKKDIEEVEVGSEIFDQVEQLPVAEFRLKSDPASRQVRRGFIAQDAHQVFPEVVKNTNLNYQKVYRKTSISDVWYFKKNYQEPVSDEIRAVSNIEISDNPLIGTLTTEKDAEFLTIDSGELSSLIFKTIKALTVEYQQNYLTLKQLIEENSQDISLPISSTRLF